MKQLFRFFSLLAMAVVTSTAAWAYDVPAPKAQALQADVEVYVYNVATKRFLGWGEAWGTQSCATTSGLKYILKNKRDDGARIEFLGNGGFDEVTGEELTQLPEGQYWLYSPEISGKAGHSIDRWQDGKCGTEYRCSFADQSDWIERGVWQIASVGNNVYTLQVPQGLTTDLEFHNLYVEGQFAGILPEHGSNAAQPTYGLYSDIVYADHPENCQFLFVSVDEHDLFAARTNLANKMDEAKEKGADVSEYESLLTSGTVSEINDAIDAINDLIENLASRHNPVDVTDKYLKNGNCGITQSMDGWTIKGANGASYENNCWEFWNISGGPSIEQSPVLPAGLYKLDVRAYTRTDMHATLQFGDETKELVTYPSDVVNNRETAKNLFAGDPTWGLNRIVLAQDETKETLVKLTASSTDTGDHWIVWQSFNLIYYGNTDDDFKAYVAVAMDGWEKEFENENYTPSYFTGVENAILAGENISTKDEAKAAYQKAMEALEELRKNVQLYKDLSEYTTDDIYNEQKFAWSEELEEAYLEIYELFESEDFTKSNEYLEELLARYRQLRQDAQDAANLEDGQDVTDKLINPHFIDDNGNSSFKGWTIDSDGGFQNNAGNSGVVEQWNGNNDNGKSIDVWQEVRLMHVGAYRLETKGWYRCDNINEAYNKWAAGDRDVIGYLYASYSKDKFHNVFEHFYEAGAYEGDFPQTAEGGSPNNVVAANSLFNQTNDWDMSVDFLSLGEPTKLGIKGENLPSHAWIIWDDFKLTYLGDDLDTMREVAAKEAEAATEIIDGDDPMSKEAADALRDCVNQIEDANDKDALLDAYKNIGTQLDNARKSIANYKRLQDAVNDLQNTLNDYMDTASEEAQSQANEVINEVLDGIDAGSIKDSEINDVLARIKKAKNALKMPANVKDASDANPIDMTSMIENPKYTVDGVASLNGWLGTSHGAELRDYDYSYAEGWGNTDESASFDLYQDFEDMPMGTYLLQVNGLCRLGGVDADRKMTQYGYAEANGWLDLLDEEAKKDVPAVEERGKFYANNDSAAFHRWIFIGTDEWDAEAMSEFAFSGEGSYKEYVDSLTNGKDDPQHYYFPDNRENLYFHTQGSKYYENSLYCFVAEDGKLRIGACNKNAKANDWTPFSNWRLTYFGENSEHQPDAIDLVRERVTGEIQAIYTIDGRRINSLQKGLNIIIRNGKAQKVLVK